MGSGHPPKSRFAKYVRCAHEIAFSIYFPLLLIWVNNDTTPAGVLGARIAWVVKMELLISGGRYPHSFMDPTLRFAFAFLWALSAVVVFLCLRILGRFSFTHVFLRTFAGIVALAGFPLACVYVYRSLAWTLVEAVAILVCACFYVFRSWPARAWWALLPLVLHSAFWTWAAWDTRTLGHPGFLLLWPGYDLTWLTHEYPNLIYPLLGFLASVVWGLYVRQSAEPTQTPKPVPAT
jgi:hypothetical protein